MVQISDIAFNADVDMNGVLAYPCLGNCPPEEAAALLLDNDENTKWLDLEAGSFILQWPMGSLQIIRNYRFRTANDAPGRSPVKWTAQVSTDCGQSWHFYHHQTESYDTSTDPFVWVPAVDQYFSLTGCSPILTTTTVLLLIETRDTT